MIASGKGRKAFFFSAGGGTTGGARVGLVTQFTRGIITCVSLDAFPFLPPPLSLSPRSIYILFIKVLSLFFFFFFFFAKIS